MQFSVAGLLVNKRHKLTVKRTDSARAAWLLWHLRDKPSHGAMLDLGCCAAEAKGRARCRVVMPGITGQYIGGVYGNSQNLSK